MPKVLGVVTSPPDATAASSGFLCTRLVAATASGSLSALFRGWQLPVRFEARREPARACKLKAFLEVTAERGRRMHRRAAFERMIG